MNYKLLLIFSLWLSSSSSFILITNLYNEGNLGRINEYLLCMEKNLANGLIEKIHVIYDGCEDEESSLLNFLKANDIEVSYHSGRPSFRYCFDLANSLYPGKKIVLSNADIYFNQSLGLLQNCDLKNKFLALTRWNVMPNGSLRPYFKRGKHTRIYCSQDTWIFEAPIKLFGDSEVKMGMKHSDGVIAYQAKKAGLLVLNPCLSIQCCHLHLSEVRNYENAKRNPKRMMAVRWSKLK